MVLLLVLFFGSFTLFAYKAIAFVRKMLRIQKMVSDIPGPPSVPFFGHSLKFAGVRDVEGLWKVFTELTKGGDGIQKLWLGPVLEIAVDDPVYANIVMTHSASTNKHPWYSVFSFGENGLFISNGEHYERLRKSLSKSFHPKTVTNWHDFMAAKATQAVEFLEEKVGQGEYDVSELTLYFALDLACKIILGEDVNEMKHQQFNFHRPLSEAVAISFARVFKPQYFNDFIFKMTRLGQEYEKSCVQITALLRHIIRKRITELEERGIDLKSNFEEEVYTDTIIKLGREEDLSLEAMARMLSDIPTAGSDTSAVAAAFMLLYLAMHPQYQQEAYEEQIAVLGDSRRAPTVEEVGRMHFLSLVEKEVLRLQGPPLIARCTDDEMEIGGYSIPKGTTLAVLINKIHRNPKYYDNPNEFNPHRFSPENVARRQKFAFFPMSNGHRRCPGGLFSHLSVLTLISVLLRNYKFSTSRKYDEMKFKYSLMLESAVGYPVLITRRTNIHFSDDN